VNRRPGGINVTRPVTTWSRASSASKFKRWERSRATMSLVVAACDRRDAPVAHLTRPFAPERIEPAIAALSSLRDDARGAALEVGTP
jgi:hypothetical protein